MLFGGVNVIFLGDFFQMKPVQGTSLMSNIHDKSNWHKGKSPTLASFKGHQIWNFTT